MGIIYQAGENKTRPGVYLRFVNRGADSVAPVYPQEPPTPPVKPEEISVFYDESGLVTISIPGCTVSHDGNGNVLLSGITMQVTDDGDGNITIGGA